MKHRTIIISAVALIVLGMFWGYRYTKLRTSQQQHIQTTYQRMTEMAKKSAISGLPQMARALNRYYTDHHAYPPNLNVLYPHYIQSRSFISDITWQYRPRSNNFMLTKSVSKDNRIIVATIDKELRPKSPRDMVAKAPLPQTPTALAKNIVEDVPEKVPLQLPASINGTPRSTSSDSVVLSSKDKKTYTEISEQKEKPMPMKEITRSPNKQPPEAEEMTHEQLIALSQNYFVWKDKKGRLGFSNIQYPDKREVGSIFVGGGWEAFKD